MAVERVGRRGRYRHDVAPGVLARYEAALGQPDLLSVADDLALLEARVGERLAAVQEGGGLQTWRQLRATCATFQGALQAGDIPGMEAAFGAMRRLILTGSEEAAVWDEIRRLMETRAKLVATEMKTLTSLQQLVTVQQLMLMLGAAMDATVQAVQTYADPVSGRNILREVQAAFTRLASVEGR